MNLLLEPLLDPLVFLYSATLALLAAALGLWHLRFAASPKSPAAAPPPAPLSTTYPVPLPSVALAETDSVQQGSSKGRFTAYFCAEGEAVGADEDEEEDRVGEECGEGLTSLVLVWRGDLGWYRYQDRAAIDGSVVRLWNGSRGL